MLSVISFPVHPCAVFRFSNSTISQLLPGLPKLDASQRLEQQLPTTPRALQEGILRVALYSSTTTVRLRRLIGALYGPSFFTNEGSLHNTKHEVNPGFRTLVCHLKCKCKVPA